MSSQKLKDSGIAAIFKSKSTVFTPQELAAVWGITDQGYLKTRITYYLKKGYLYRLGRGLYAKDKDDFERREAANKLRTPSYVSLETVLAQEGMVFQRYSAIFLVSYAPRVVKVAGSEFVYKKIKDKILFNPAGIINAGTYLAASCERAFLDAVYLYKNYHFDNLRPLDWKKVEELLPVFGAETLERRVEEYKKDAGAE